MATSTGEGIGLQSGNRSDYWMRRLADDQRIADANARADEKALVDAMDINVDLSKYLPKYAKAISGEYSTFLNDVAKMRQGGTKPTIGQVKMMALKAQEKMAGYAMANEIAKEYVSAKDIEKDENVVADLVSSEGTVKDLAKHDDGMFIRFGNNGEFAYTPVSNKTIPVAFDKQFDYEKKPTGNRKRVGDVDWQEVTSELTPNALDREAAQLYNKKEFITQTLFKNRKEVAGMSDEEKVEFIRQSAYQRAKSEAPMVATEWKDKSVYHPPQGTESQRRTPVIVKTTGGIMSNTPVYIKNSDGTVEKTEGPQSQVASYDAVVNIGDVKPITVVVTDEIRKLNPELEGVKSVSVQPKSLYRVTGEGGVKQLLAGGSVISMVGGDEVDEEGNLVVPKPSKSFEPILPYSVVQSETEKTYPGKMQTIYEELEIGKKSAKKEKSKKKSLY